MSDITAETVLQQITALPLDEQLRLERLLEQWRNERVRVPIKPPLDKRLPPKPMPDSSREMQWLSDHAREYAGQWVALDGDRLIAHSPDYQQVFAAADADGAPLPLITSVEDPDHPVHIIWK